METKKTPDLELKDYPYITFDDALKLAEKIKTAGGHVDREQMQQVLGSKGGWFAMQLSSLRRWGLIEGWGDSNLTSIYRRIKDPDSPGDDLKAKQESFLHIPLFRSIYDQYKDHGLPQEPYLSNKLKNSYNLSGRNPSLVASIIREFVSKYFLDYGKPFSSEKPKTKSVASEDLIKSDVSSHQDESLMQGSFPITILTNGTPPFKWDIKSETDFAIVDSVVASIKERWKKIHKENNNSFDEKS